MALQAYVLNVFTLDALEAGVAALEGRMPYQGGVGPIAPTWAALNAATWSEESALSWVEVSAAT